MTEAMTETTTETTTEPDTTTGTDFPWEPPLAGTEPEHLLGALDRLRTTFRWKADDLDAAGLRARIGASPLTLGGLLKHLPFVQAVYSQTKRGGQSPGLPWESIDWDAQPGWDFSSAADDSPEELYALYDDAVEAARAAYGAAVAKGGLDTTAAPDWNGGREPPPPDGTGARDPSLRRLLFDLVEEYGRHTGHADLLREAVDGLVGEDPPARWHPRSPRPVPPPAEPSRPNSPTAP